MTVNATVGRRVAIASADQTEFTFNFTISASSDIEVYQRGQNDTPSDSDLLVLNLDYTVTIDGDNGGSVFLNSGASENDFVIIQLGKDYERVGDFTQDKQFTASNINADLDNNLQGQKQNDMRYQSLTPHYFDSASLTNSRDLRLPVLGAGQSWRMNTAGTAISVYDTPEDDPGAAALRSDLAASTGAALVGTDDGYGTVQQSLDGANNKGVKYGVDTGSTNSIQVAFSPPDTEYITGELLLIKPANSNTGATTINKNSLGNKSLVNRDGSSLDPNMILSNQIFECVYDGTNYVLLSESSGLQILTKGQLYGMSLSAVGADPDHDITIASGSARDSSDGSFINLSSQITKQIDAVWVAGDNAGGLPSTVSLTANTTYHVFVIEKNDGTTDAGFDTSITADNLLAESGYDRYRRVGSRLTDASSNLFKMHQYGDYNWYVDMSTSLATSFPVSASVQSITLKIPSGLKLGAIISTIIEKSGVSGSRKLYVFSPYEDAPASVDDRWLTCEYNKDLPRWVKSSRLVVLSDTSARINVIANSGAAITCYATAQGFIDYRDRL